MPGCRVLSRWLFVRRASAVASVVACLALLPLCGGLPAFDRSASAAPMGGSQQWDFRIDDGRSTGGAWTASHSGGGPAAERWRWIGPSRRNDGRWAEVAAAGRGHEGRGNYLTSPVIDVKAMLGTTADAFRFSIAQRFDFYRASRGPRVVAGEIAYSLDGGSFVAIPASAFTSGGSIYDASFHGIASPFATQPGLVNQTAFVSPRGSWSGPPPLLKGGGLFTGRSARYARGAYVPTECLLDFRSSGIFFSTIQFRLIEASMGSRCAPRSRWDVQFAQVDVVAPEPSGLVLGGLGCVVLALAWLRGRRRTPPPADVRNRCRELGRADTPSGPGRRRRADARTLPCFKLRSARRKLCFPKRVARPPLGRSARAFPTHERDA
jgi:hypothetical protein